MSTETTRKSAPKKIEAEKVDVVGSEKEGKSLPNPSESQDPIIKFLKKNWFTIAVIIYFFMPIDLIPDLIPIVGQLDDGGLILIEVARRLYEWKGKQNETSST